MMLGYVPAPPTTADALLTQSGARQGSGRHYLRHATEGYVLKRPFITAIGSRLVLPLDIEQRRFSGRATLAKIDHVPVTGLVTFLPQDLGSVWQFLQLLSCHLLSPDRWLRSNTILPQSLFETCQKARIHWRKWRICNAKINCLTTFSACGVDQHVEVGSTIYTDA